MTYTKINSLAFISLSKLSVNPKKPRGATAPLSPLLPTPTMNMILIPGHGPISNPKVDQEALKLSNQFVDACNPFLREVSRSFLEAADPKGVPFKKPYYH